MLDEYTFEDLCRDLFEEQETVSTCNVYGQRGEPQSGIDLRAQRRDGDAIEVGQCKACKDFEPAKIVAASDEFFKAWDDVWSKQRVRLFILLVAGSLDQDAAGHKAAARLLAHLGPRAVRVRLPAGVKDVADLARIEHGPDLFRAAILSATAAAECV